MCRVTGEASSIRMFGVPRIFTVSVRHGNSTGKGDRRNRRESEIEGICRLKVLAGFYTTPVSPESIRRGINGKGSAHMDRMQSRWNSIAERHERKTAVRRDWLWDEGESPEYRSKHFGEWHEPDRSFTRNAGLVNDVLGRMSPEARIRTEAEILASETVATARLEGVRLNRKSVLTAILNAYGFDTHRRAGAAETAMAGFTLDVHRNFDSPLTEARLMSWHESIGRARGASGDLGRYRESDERKIPRNVDRLYPSGFRGVRAARVPAEMKRFIWMFNRNIVRLDEKTEPLSSLPWVYLYFLQIRPFGKCNGTLARALLAMTIARRLGCATPMKMSYEIRMCHAGHQKIIDTEIWNMETSGLTHYLGKAGLSVSRRTLRVVEGYGKSPSAFSRRWTTGLLRATGCL